MRNLKLILEYDGTNYAGFQRQSNALTIQEVLEEKLSFLTEEKLRVIASGRTDAGVHAQGQAVNFYTACSIPAQRFPLALNTMLPPDITVSAAREVPLDFHSCYSSQSKVYSYKILNRRTPSPFLRKYAYHFPRRLNLGSMKEGAQCFLGEHDFAAFRSLGSSVRTTVRHIYRLEINEEVENLIELEIEANGFLYNMVRIIVGTLLQIGLGKISPQDLPEIIKSKERQRAGETVPAHGLCLKEVKYFSNVKNFS